MAIKATLRPGFFNPIKAPRWRLRELAPPRKYSEPVCVYPIFLFPIMTDIPRHSPDGKRNLPSCKPRKGTIPVILYKDVPSLGSKGEIVLATCE